MHICRNMYIYMNACMHLFSNCHACVSVICLFSSVDCFLIAVHLRKNILHSHPLKNAYTYTCIHIYVYIIALLYIREYRFLYQFFRSKNPAFFSTILRLREKCEFGVHFNLLFFCYCLKGFLCTLIFLLNKLQLLTNSPM